MLKLAGGAEAQQLYQLRQPWIGSRFFTSDLLFRSANDMLVGFYGLGATESMSMFPGALEADEWEAKSHINLVDILEGMAQASELWRTNLTMQEVERLIQRGLLSQNPVYWNCLDVFIKSVRPFSDPQSFIVNFLALCDLSLCGPLLAEHKRARQDSSDAFPVARFNRLLQAFSDATRPATGVDETNRLTRDLCRAAKLAAPSEYLPVFGTTASDYYQLQRLVTEDLREHLYMRSQYDRTKRPGLFTNYDIVLYLTGEGRTFFTPITSPRLKSIDHVCSIMKTKNGIPKLSRGGDSR